jgi:hypothetical protein
MTNYTAHLVAGGTLALAFKNGVDSQPGSKYAWLRDDNGVMVNMTHVAALVPQDAPAVSDGPLPARVIDRDGDIWTREPDGRYEFSGLAGYSLDEVEKMYGPWTEVK